MAKIYENITSESDEVKTGQMTSEESKSYIEVMYILPVNIPYSETRKYERMVNNLSVS